MRIIPHTLLLSVTISASLWISGVEAKPVNFAANTPTLSGTLPLIVGQEFGFFAAEGLEVKTVFIRGGPTAMAALVGGGVDYTLVAGVAAVRAIAQNAPMLIVSGIQPYMDYTLLGAKRIGSASGLKGKAVRCTGPGGVRRFAAFEGLTKRDWCATVITKFFTVSATVRREPRRWKPVRSRPRRFLFWKEWNSKRRAFRLSSTSAASCQDFHSW